MPFVMNAQSQSEGLPLLFRPGFIPKATRATRRMNMFTKPRQPRSTSPSSTDADYGSSDEDEIETMEEYAENLLEEEEVATWLRCSDPQPWHSPNLIAPMESPLTMSSVPGPLLLQLFQFLLVYFGYVPREKKYTMPVPHRMRPREPLSPVHYFDPETRLKQARYLGVTAPPLEDESIYVVLFTPGKDEEIERIRMTRDISFENMQTHKSGALRVYRVHEDRIVDFTSDLNRADLAWLWVRKPRHAFDTIAVYRHGYRNWDIGSDKEWWALVSSKDFTETVRLREISARTAKWPLSRKGRVYFGFYRLINWSLQWLGVQVRVPDLLRC